jgi:hypothetical protein
MGHNPATREVKKGEKKVADALRTPEERLSAIRGSLAAKLYVTPDDIRFLLALYDESLAEQERCGTTIRAQHEVIVDHITEIERLKAPVDVPLCIPGESPIYVEGDV